VPANNLPGLYPYLRWRCLNIRENDGITEGHSVKLRHAWRRPKN
jgi:hypothetical protein